jgi:hypothetical protein
MAWLGLIVVCVASGVFFLVSLFFLMLAPTIVGAPGSGQQSGASSFLVAVVALPLILGGCMIYGGWLAYQGQPVDAIWTILGGMGVGALLLALGGSRYFA